jgi:hypothetical protein
MTKFFEERLSSFSKGNVTMKAKLYVSVWARLGFTVEHLVKFLVN